MTEPKQKRAFIEYTKIDLKGVETQLTRIADALEIIVSQQYDINLSPIPPDKSKSDDTVEYVDETREFVRELEEEVRGRASDEPEEQS